MTDVIQEAEKIATTLYGKFEDWVHGTVEPALARDEKELITLLQPLFGRAEAAAMQDLTVFITAVVTQAVKGASLADLETAVMNGLQVAKSSLLVTAEQLGSAALQALIGLILAKLA